MCCIHVIRIINIFLGKIKFCLTGKYIHNIDYQYYACFVEIGKDLPDGHVGCVDVSCYNHYGYYYIHIFMLFGITH